MRRRILLVPLVLLLVGAIRLDYNLRRFDEQRKKDRATLEAALDQRSRLWNERLTKLKAGQAEQEALLKRIDQLAKDLNQ